MEKNKTDVVNNAIKLALSYNQTMNDFNAYGAKLEIAKKSREMQAVKVDFNTFNANDWDELGNDLAQQKRVFEQSLNAKQKEMYDNMNALSTLLAIMQNGVNK